MAAKGFFSLPELFILLATRECILSHKPGAYNFLAITNIILNNIKFAILLLYNGPVLLLSGSDKAKLFGEMFTENPNLNDKGSCFAFFCPKINLKVDNIFITPKVVKV